MTETAADHNMTPMNPAGGRGPALPVTRYRLTFGALEPLVLPGFEGAFWRSVLGRELHDNAPALFQQFFVTPKANGGGAVPHPYLFPMPVSASSFIIAAGEAFDVDLTIIGQGNAHAAAIISALERCARNGLGQTRGKAELLQVMQRPLSPPPVAPPPAAIVRLTTPLRLVTSQPHPSTGGQAKGCRRKSLLTPGRFQASHLLISLLRRIRALMHFHVPQLHAPQDPDADFPVLKKLALAARMSDAGLRLFDASRWLASQRQQVPMGHQGMV